MNEKMGRDKLLDDVLRDDTLDALRESVLKQSRRELARKRWTRLKWWALPAAAAVIFLLFKLLVVRDEPVSPVYEETRSYLVTTVRLTEDQVIRTRSLEGIEVSTKDYPPAIRITDEEMLALFEGVPCGLMRIGEQRTTLVFPRPEDEERFIGNLGG